MRATLRNDATEPFSVGALRLVLPVPSAARSSCSTSPAGTPWSGFRSGSRSRTARTRARPGAAGLASTRRTCWWPGTAGFGFRTGEVWGVHLAGAATSVYAERLFNGARLLGAASCWRPARSSSRTASATRTPWLYAGSATGLDGVAERFHRFLRGAAAASARRRGRWCSTPGRRSTSTTTSPAAGAGRTGRRGRRRALRAGRRLVRRPARRHAPGWATGSRRPTVWPDGLGPLVDHVTALGMEFGLWFEPEMVNLDSDLARAHPEWCSRRRPDRACRRGTSTCSTSATRGRTTTCWSASTRCSTTYDIDYLKWDHNRDLDRRRAPARRGRRACTRRRSRVYRLLDELRAAPSRPGDRVLRRRRRAGRPRDPRAHRPGLAEDCNDALERQQIQRWTQLLLPPELIGAHVGHGTAHTTAAAAQPGVPGGHRAVGPPGDRVGPDQASAADLAELKSWVALHKRLRPLLHAGTVINVDHPDPRSGSTGWCRTTSGRRCSRSPRWVAVRRGRPGGPGCRGSIRRWRTR